jgi:hypothetical protein
MLLMAQKEHQRLAATLAGVQVDLVRRMDFLSDQTVDYQMDLAVTQLC